MTNSLRRPLTPTSQPGRRYASVAVAAAYWSASPKLIRKLLGRGTLTCYQLPGSRLIRVDLDEMDAIAERS